MTDGTTYCAVKVQEEDFTDVVLRVQVDESDHRADIARVVLGDTSLVLCDVLHEGMPVEIDLGRTDEHAVVFRGVVTSVAVAFPPVGAPTVELIAHDSLILLSLAHRSRRWANTTTSAIVRQIALAHGLVPGRIELTADRLFPEDRPAQQVAETDLAFLERLAADCDARLFVDHCRPVDQLCCVATATLAAAEPLERSLVFNATLNDFRVAFDAWAADPSEQLVTTADDDGATVAISTRLLESSDTVWVPDATRIGRMGPGGARVARVMTRSASTRAALADHWRVPPRVAGVPARARGDATGAKGDRQRRRGQTGRGRAGGSIWLQPRARVTIEGYGGRWSGVWTLARVRHDVELATRSYTTSFTCVR